MKKLLISIVIAFLMISLGCNKGEKEENVATKEGFVEVDEGINIFHKIVVRRDTQRFGIPLRDVQLTCTGK